MRARRLLTLLLLTALALGLRTPRITRAASITVNSVADVVANDGQCTLCEAIIAANTDTASGGAAGECVAGSGDDTLDLTGISGFIHLGGPLPEITSNVVVVGPGRMNLIVRRNSGGDYRVCRVSAAANVTIAGLTISTGRVVGDHGGGIYNAGTLTLTDSTVSGNNAYLGGGIYNAGTLTLVNSTVRGSTAEQGGGIYNDAGSVQLTSSTVEDNMALSDGGGIANVGAGVGGVTLADSIVSGNVATYGGGIHNAGALTLGNSFVRGNEASSGGGGLYNAGALTLTEGTVSDNGISSTIASNGHGGGIYNAITGTLTLTGSTVSDNTVLNAAHDSYGGGIYNAGTLTLTDSAVSGNNTYGDHCHGGGIHNEGTLTLNDSTVSDNHASAIGSYGDGGGIHSVGGSSSVTLNSSTVSGNSSNGGGSGGGFWNSNGSRMVLNNSTVTLNNSSNKGGGINNTITSTLTLDNSTIGSYNFASGSGGGLWNDMGGTVVWKNSIIAGNRANAGGPDCYNTATLTSLNYNLMGDDSDCLFAPQAGDQVGVDPLLGPLQDNGGPTETRALLSGSPAIDAIPIGSCTDHQGTSITADQRGVARPQGSACDVGAYEARESVDLSLSKGVDRASAPVGEPVVFTIQVTNDGPLVATGVVISDQLPVGLSFAAANTSQGSYASGTGEWQVGRLEVGLGATLTLTATADAGAAGATLTNTAAVSAADWFDPDSANNRAMAAVTVPALEQPLERLVYLPLILRNFTPLSTFPLHIGDAIPERAVAYQGEAFYTTSVQVPSELPSGGRFYFSSQGDAVAEVVVDDELVLLLDGAEVLGYRFSSSTHDAAPTSVEIPRSIMAGLAGRTVTVVYRDVFGDVVGASATWLIWVP
jgi:uncharacterized repeat protein (TIGR01451 family)/CSLREA domain-containing protein